MPNTSDNSLNGGFTFTPITRDAAGNLGGGFQFDLPLATIQTFNNQALQFTAANSAANRQFVSRHITTAQSNVTAATAQSFQLGNTMLETSKDVSKYAIRRSGFGCFITTAICEMDGKSDDCEVLQTFRQFRDGYMASRDDGAQLVQEYYDTAPELLRRLDADAHRNAVLAALRDDYLMPAYDSIQRGQHVAALTLYVAMVAALRAYVLGD